MIRFPIQCVIFALPLFLGAPLVAQNAQLEANKKAVMRFFTEQPFANPDKIDDIIHPDYIQHSPPFLRCSEEIGVKGRDGLKQCLARMMAGRGAAKKGPPTDRDTSQFIVTAEKDIVTVIMPRQAMDKEGKPYTYWWFDTWRVKDGKLYEHWDGGLMQ